MPDSVNMLEDRRFPELLALLERGRVDEALALLDNALDGEQRWAAKALVAAIVGRHSDAVRWYQTAATHSTSQSAFNTIQSGLARSLAALGEQGQALRELEKALQVPEPDLHSAIGHLWNYANIACGEVPGRYRELFEASCRVHNLHPIPDDLPFCEAILLAHKQLTKR